MTDLRQAEAEFRARLRGEDTNGRPDGHAAPYSLIETEPVEWLWPERVPLGMLTMLVGDPGLGKSLLSVDVAAKVSRAGAAALLLTAEDSPSATVRPRLEGRRACTPWDPGWGPRSGPS
jgi:hypothetical protein